MKHQSLRSLTALFMASVVVLSACSSGEVVVDEHPQSDASQSSPNLDVARISDVLREAQKSFEEADKAGDSTLLSARMSDPALRVRQAQYALAQKAGSPIPALDLTEQLLTVTNSSQWPRVILDVSQASQGALPVAYFFVQNDARSEYKLQNWTHLLGGTEFSTLSVEEGTPYLQPDAQGFIMTPQQAVDAFVAMLNSGTAGSETFTADEFSLNYQSTVQQLQQSVTSAGSVTAVAAKADFPITSVQLRDGSALVASAITYSHTYARTIARSTMKLGGSPAVVAGDPTIHGQAQANYILSILIHLPAQGQQAKASLIGLERALESVTKNDEARPEGE